MFENKIMSLLIFMYPYNDVMYLDMETLASELSECVFILVHTHCSKDYSLTSTVQVVNLLCTEGR